MSDVPKYLVEKESVPISKTQMRFWFLDQMEPGNASCNVSRRYHLKGKLDIATLQKCFEILIERHEILRSAIVGGYDIPLLKILDKTGFSMNVFHLDNLNQKEKANEARRIAYEAAAKSFQLSKPPLFRANLVCLNKDEYIFTFVIHHIIIDGTSLSILFGELESIYNSFVKNQPLTLPPTQRQYREFIRFQNEGIGVGNSERKLNFWKKNLGGELPIVEIPADNKSFQPTFNGGRIYYSINEHLVKELKKLSMEVGCSLYTVLLAAFKVLIYRYTGSEDITLGSPVANRNEEFENTLGVFINMVPIRSQVNGKKGFKEFLVLERRVTFSAFANHDYPFEDIIANICPKRNPLVPPIFQIMFQYITGKKPEFTGVEVSVLEIDTGKSQFDLSLYMWEWDDYLDGYFEFNTDLYNRKKIERLSGHFYLLLKEIVDNPDIPIDLLMFISDEEKQKLIYKFNNTHREYPLDKTIIELFEENRRKNPYRIAVEFDNIRLNYNDLNERANRLANYLRLKNLRPGDLIGISTDRSHLMVIAIIAGLKCGAAYVPLDPSYPHNRLKYMTENAALFLIITHSKYISTFHDFTGTIVDIHRDEQEIDEQPAHFEKIYFSSDSIAYVIYTSGSTGRPKGVKIRHSSVVNFLCSMREYPGINSKDILLSVTSLSFDISVLELFLPLITGAKLVLVDKDTAGDGQKLLETLKLSKATIMQATPSTWKIMLDAGWNEKIKLKILCGGETLIPNLAEQLMKRGKELWNMYGPTETTIWSSIKKISSEKEITLGSPLANTQLYVLDKNRQLLPDRVPGELYIGGAGLSAGYLNNPELTEERFVYNPFNTGSKKIYKTGDIVCYKENGELEFLRRTDDQVKLRGFRIELGEIESALISHKLIKEAAALIKESRPGDVRLFAFVVPLKNGKLKIEKLKNDLRQKLPEYMIPSSIFELEKLPLTLNGKVNKKVLKIPDPSKLGSKSEQFEPRNETEKELAYIWQNVLGLNNVGIKDDFFALGGHSLLAAILFNNINRKFNANLPLALLFNSPTIEGIAHHLKENVEDEHKSVLKIKNGNGKLPLFLIHGAEGNVLLYKELADHLHEDIQVYGVQSIYLNNSDSTVSSIEEMADQYLQEIVSLQPEGPYYLGGYCMGGTIAFEIAQKLQKIDKSVTFLGLLESYNMNTANKSYPMRLFNKVQNLYFHIRNLVASISEGMNSFLYKKISEEKNRFILKLKIFLAKVFSRFHSDFLSKYLYFNVEKLNDDAQKKYIPKHYAGKATLIRPKTYFAGSSDFNFGWGEVADQLDVIMMNVNPRGMLVKPFVKELAELLDKSIIQKEVEPKY
jgi:amino acid adenylation domain-containing protein